MSLNYSIKKVVPETPAKLVNYNFEDLASGTGYITIYAGNTFTDSAKTYKLSNFTFYSDKVATSGAGSTDDTYFHQSQDLDFDVEFNLPQLIKGKTIVNVPIAIQGYTSARNYDTFAHVRLRKWDGTTETEIADASGASVQTVGNTAAHAMSAIELDVPLTHFKKGETLRLTIEQWDRVDASSTVSAVYIGNDPMNRTETRFGTDPTILTLQLPVRIDVS